MADKDRTAGVDQTETSTSAPRKKTYVAVLLIVIAVLIGAAAVFFATRTPTPTPPPVEALNCVRGLWNPSPPAVGAVLPLGVVAEVKDIEPAPSGAVWVNVCYKKA